MSKSISEIVSLPEAGLSDAAKNMSTQDLIALGWGSPTVAIANVTITELKTITDLLQDKFQGEAGPQGEGSCCTCCPCCCC